MNRFNDGIKSSFFHQRFTKFWQESFCRRMIGFTLCRAWVYVSFFNTAMAITAKNPQGTMDFVYHVSLVALVVCLILCGILDKKMEKFFMSGLSAYVPAAITIIGSLLVLLANTDSSLGVVLIIVSGMFTGFGSGVILTYWGRIYSACGGPTSAAECSLAFLLGTLLIPFYVVIPLWLQMFILSLLPLGSSLLLLKEFNCIDHQGYIASNAKKQTTQKPENCSYEETEQTEQYRSGFTNLLKISISSLVFGSIIGIVRTLYSSTSGMANSFATNLILPTGALIAAFIIISILLFSRRLDLVFSYKPVVIFMTISCIIMPVIDTNFFLTYTLAMAGYFCFEIMNWVMLADITYRFHISAYRIYCFGRAAVTGGVLIGEMIGRILNQTQPIPTETLYGVSFGLILLMVITYTLTLTERDVAKITRMDARAFKLPASAFEQAESPASTTPSEQEEKDSKGSLQERIDALAMKYAITGRAYDILVLMAKGRTASRIEKELYVSRGTVNTYSHRIYQTLDIHSRQELYDLLEDITIE